MKVLTLIGQGFRNLFYSIGQAFKNLFRNKGYAIASIATITACLFMFSIFYAIIVNIRSTVQTAEQDVSVTVFFNEGTTEDQIQQLRVDVLERPEVQDCTYVSAEQAWEDFSSEYLEGYADSFTENPLENYENLVITLKDVSGQSDLVSFLQGQDIVRLVNYSEVTADTLTGANRLMWYISAGIIIILLIVSIFLISNTIATGITSHRDEIYIMKYIGATDYFVRAPYVYEGIILGLIGSVIPLLLIYFMYDRAISLITTRFAILKNLFTFVSVNEIFRTLAPTLLVLGVGIGFVGSMLTIRRHLRV